jgi:membrane protein
MSDTSGAEAGAAVARAAKNGQDRAVRFGLRMGRSMRLGVRAVGRGAVGFYHSDNLTFAASIAYYSLLSLFPFSLLVLSVLSHITASGTGATLLQLVTRALPARVEFLTQIEELGPRALELGVAGTLVMLWASMGVFGALTSAVNHAWGVEKPPSFFKHKLIAFVMLMAAGALMVIALLLVGAIQVAETTWFSPIVARFPVAGELRSFMVRNAVTPMFILVVGLIYYYAPNAKVRLRDVWVGALLAGFLWRGAFALFSWYLRDLSRFSVHGSVATVIAFLIWIYLSAVILLYGAEVSAAYARLRKHLPQQAPAAPERDPA